MFDCLIGINSLFILTTIYQMSEASFLKRVHLSFHQTGMFPRKVLASESMSFVVLDEDLRFIIRNILVAVLILANTRKIFVTLIRVFRNAVVVLQQ